MKFILSTIVLFSCSTLFAQERIEINGKSRINLDSFTNTAQSSAAPSSKMPNALQGFKDNQKLKVNNHHGFDIYQSQVDNMAVLKPDANNAGQLKMPIWNYKSDAVYANIYDCEFPIGFTCNYGDASGGRTNKPTNLRKLRPLQLNVLPIQK